jgi:hypothetical protein
VDGLLEKYGAYGDIAIRILGTIVSEDVLASDIRPAEIRRYNCTVIRTLSHRVVEADRGTGGESSWIEPNEIGVPYSSARRVWLRETLKKGPALGTSVG